MNPDITQVSVSDVPGGTTAEAFIVFKRGDMTSRTVCAFCVVGDGMTCDRCVHLAPSGACRTHPLPGRPCNEFATAQTARAPQARRQGDGPTPPVQGTASPPPAPAGSAGGEL
jgi:hypothetical protein